MFCQCPTRNFANGRSAVLTSHKLHTFKRSKGLYSIKFTWTSAAYALRFVVTIDPCKVLDIFWGEKNVSASTYISIRHRKGWQCGCQSRRQFDLLNGTGANESWANIEITSQNIWKHVVWACITVNWLAKGAQTVMFSMVVKWPTAQCWVAGYCAFTDKYIYLCHVAVPWAEQSWLIQIILTVLQR